jgi:hypothetical protein
VHKKRMLQEFLLDVTIYSNQRRALQGSGGLKFAAERI